MAAVSQAEPNEVPRSCAKDVGSGRPYLVRGGDRVRLRARLGLRVRRRAG